MDTEAINKFSKEQLINLIVANVTALIVSKDCDHNKALDLCQLANTTLEDKGHDRLDLDKVKDSVKVLIETGDV